MRPPLPATLGPCAARHAIYGPCDESGSAHVVHHGADLDGWWWAT